MGKTSQFHDGKTALITGAAGGIGYELTELFAKDRYNLVLVDRNRDRLPQVAEDLRNRYGSSVRACPRDLSIPTAPREIFSELHQESVHIDVLVNNAGFDAYGSFHEIDLDLHLDMIQVNVASLTHLTRLFLPSMVEKGEGKILNLASLAAFMPTSHQTVYGATKAYVLSFSEALREELRGSGVSVTALCPGITLTDFYATGHMNVSRVPSFMTMDAKTVARIGYRGLMKNKRVVIPGFGNKLYALFEKSCPRGLLARIGNRATAGYGQE